MEIYNTVRVYNTIVELHSYYIFFVISTSQLEIYKLYKLHVFDLIFIIVGTRRAFKGGVG